MSCRLTLGLVVLVDVLGLRFSRWPRDWPNYRNWSSTDPNTGKHREVANANQVVIARINGEWYGGAWEALTRPYWDTGACRVMEAAKKKEAGHGPIAQVERDPFWTWFPEAGD